jgi:hypothetical protein
MTGDAITIDLTAEKVVLMRHELLLCSPAEAGTDFEPTTRSEITTALDALQVFLAELDQLGWDDEPSSLTLPADKWTEVAADLFTQAGEQMEPAGRGLGEMSRYAPHVQLAASIAEHVPAREPVAS